MLRQVFEGGKGADGYGRPHSFRRPDDPGDDVVVRHAEVLIVIGQHEVAAEPDKRPFASDAFDQVVVFEPFQCVAERLAGDAELFRELHLFRQSAAGSILPSGNCGFQRFVKLIAFLSFPLHYTTVFSA